MAVALIDLVLLHKLKTEGYLPAGSSVIEVGAQQLAESVIANNAELDSLAQAFGVKEPYPRFAAASSTADNLLAGSPLARDMWEWLGLKYACVDIDGTPGSIPLDLNFDAIPDEARSKYQLVTNFGTTEHAANQLNAFKIIHDLAATDGIMIHNLPCYWPEHGLLSYNPKFFSALAKSNGYKVIYMDMLLASETDFPGVPESIVSDFSAGRPDFAEKWRRYQVPPCSIHIALLKQFNIEFVPPIDVTSGAATDDPVLKRRYWTVFDRRALDGIAQSIEARTQAVFTREQAAAAAEGEIKHRQWEAYDREQQVARRDQAAHAREQAVFDREQRMALREQAVGAVEDQAVGVGEDQAVGVGEDQAVGVGESDPISVRLRRSVARHAPWLVTLKRRLWGLRSEHNQ